MKKTFPLSLFCGLIFLLSLIQPIHAIEVLPFPGGWNGDGIDHIGIYSNGMWYLCNSNTNGIPNVNFAYGAAGDIPLVGNWDGNGIDTIGVYRNGVFYLRNSNTNGVPDVSFVYGAAGDIPVVGDWDGNGIDTIGVYRNGVFYLRNSNTNGVPYLTITYGQPGVIPAPVAGFTAAPRSGNAPLTVSFTDQSMGIGPFTNSWDFDNDGTVDSTLPSPLHMYPEPGTYSVKLTVTNGAGSTSDTKTDYITVNEAPPGSSHAGVALTFDDNAVENWYATQDLLKKYNAHVTYFVSSFGGFSESEINTLKILQENGHEIAFHGAHHTDAQEYLNNHTIGEYLNYEIIPGIDRMNDAGFHPVDFAYPYGSENESLTGVLQGYFLHVRGTDYREPGTPLKDVDSVFYQYGSNQPHIYGIGIDDVTYGNSLDDIKNGIIRAKQEDSIVIFYAHTPVETNPQVYQMTYDRLEKILINVSENKMTFYKISEIN